VLSNEALSRPVSSPNEECLTPELIVLWEGSLVWEPIRPNGVTSPSELSLVVIDWVEFSVSGASRAEQVFADRDMPRGGFQPSDRPLGSFPEHMSAV
jgi:hypothetical protein